MTGTEHISHEGIVTNRIGDKAIVHLIKPEECHSCRMKEFCGVTDEDRSRFEVPVQDLEIGDTIALELKPGIGFRALFWAYLFPFLLVLFVITVGSWWGLSEQWLGVLSLLVLPPYFLGLSRFKKELKSQLNLKVSKL